ncbi:hypothetical protein ACTD5D_09815 [Nocardia takedensis]|uniref:hypothetical protein n=1 Tax=Nocardia takedensis TaxID=259390 RepID=UPI003F76BD55
MATTTTAPLLERRALYILIIAALTGIGAGVLTYRPTHVAPTAIGCGIAAACLTIGWLHGVRWSALRGWHGAGLAVISIGFGSGMGALAYWGANPIECCVITAVSSAATALYTLPKFVP